jgi:hypothetical protein
VPTPQNAFELQADPLAGGTGSTGGAWGAAGQGAGGFGTNAAAASGAEEYDVVEISEDQPAPAPVPSGRISNVSTEFLQGVSAFCRAPAQ